ncbi:hypothetical protein AKL17_3p0049 (plasmid) [Frigidibacter mobilis]|uniref:Uncharacterized protein n=1 Tax=Frigidibacter mobilis TaxID=1335048 RepID=A0A159Z9F0_9RHOB|nr:hypothetical protein AKL17_3p0049 [Frigidibacter mobilis]
MLGLPVFIADVLFPARAGMHRWRRSIVSLHQAVPRSRGMNRDRPERRCLANAVPRSRGDEPMDETVLAGLDHCSPLARG